METRKKVFGKRTKKRWLALVFAILLAFQPAMSIFASDLEQATVRGDGYVIRTQPNGEKTITFEADLIAGSVEDTVEKSRSEKMRVQYADKETKSVRLPEVVSSVEEVNGQTNVAITCGSLQMQFYPEVKENPTSQLIGSEQVKTKSEEETQVETQQDTTPSQTEAVQAATEVLEEKIQTEVQTEVQTEHRQESEISENSTESEITAERVADLSEETEVEKEAESDAETEKWNGITEAFMEESTEVQTETQTVLVPDSELHYQELSDGIKEELVIYGYRGGHAVSYEMDFGGLIPVREGNAFHLQDTDGDVCASISAPYLYDASGSKCYDVDTAMVQVSGNRWKLTYTPSDQWLSDAARQWPVVLDPTITINKNELVEDNYAQDGRGTNYDKDSASLLAGKKGGKSYTAYIRPVFSDAVKKLAPNIIIRSAQTSLYVKDRGGSKAETYSFYQVTENWKSATITGKNAPSLASVPFYTGALADGGNQIDIKPLVSNWFNNLDQMENCGFAIKCVSSCWI